MIAGYDEGNPGRRHGAAGVWQLRTALYIIESRRCSPGPRQIRTDDMTTPTEHAPAIVRAGRTQTIIAAAAILAIAAYLIGRFLKPSVADLPLLAALILGGGWLVLGLLNRVAHGEFGSDLLAGISIVTSLILGEYLAGTLVVLMLSGGEALEAYAVRRASSALNALARRMPSVAHRTRDGVIEDIPLADVAVGDVVIVFPHETCPVDGVVTDGHGTMDESYLTGEPYLLVQGSGIGCSVRRGQRRLRPHHPGDPPGDRFPLRQDHAGDARIRTAAAATAPPRRSTGGVVHPLRGRRSPWLPGRAAATRSAFWRCWWWRLPARSSSPFPWRSSGPSRWPPGGES